jgi:hypothetical protein
MVSCTIASNVLYAPNPRVGFANLVFREAGQRFLLLFLEKEEYY